MNKIITLDKHYLSLFELRCHIYALSNGAIIRTTLYISNIVGKYVCIQVYKLKVHTNGIALSAMTYIIYVRMCVCVYPCTCTRCYSFCLHFAIVV